MAKVNPNRYAIPALPVETRKFPEPLHPGVTLEISLRPIVGFTEFSDMLAKAAELKRKYVTGYEKPNAEGKMEKVDPAIVIDGKNNIIAVTEKTAEAVAQLLFMQAGPAADLYNELEWFQVSGTFPSAFFAIFEFALAVNGVGKEDEEEDAKKKPETPEAPSSAPIFGPQDITPESPSAPTLSPSEVTADRA